MYFWFRKKIKYKLITGAQLELIFLGGGGAKGNISLKITTK